MTKTTFNTKKDKETIKDSVCDVCGKQAVRRTIGWGNWATFFFCKDHSKKNL